MSFAGLSPDELTLVTWTQIGEFGAQIDHFLAQQANAAGEAVAVKSQSRTQQACCTGNPKDRPTTLIIRVGQKRSPR